MCGINGFLILNHGFSENKIQGLKEKIDVMNDLIIHRGPDSGGKYFKNNVGFGFRRLSIIDLTNHANQPMLSPDNEIALVFNGEIYNYVEIREDLIKKGYLFFTESDTEVILNSYKEYGEDCVQFFNGMWAFAIFDFKKNKLFCSRDRLGVKPFYYCTDGDVFFFSSELKALHAACNLDKANRPKVYEYLAYGYRVNDGETFFENCSELLPGTNLVIEGPVIETKKYWELKEGLFVHDPKLSLEQEYINLLEDSIKLRYRSDVPVAILLSGGLDSTAIAKITDQLIDKGEIGQTDIHAYIASFPNFEDDETEIAREFIKTCKHIKLFEMQMDSKDLSLNFEKTLAELDHPLGSFASIAHNNIMRLCKKEGIKVVLNGQGSDEAFAGYVRYISGVFLVSELQKSPKSFLKEFNALNKLNGYSKKFLFSQMFKATINQSTASFLRAKYQEKSLSVLNKSFVSASKGHFKKEYKFGFNGDNFTNYLLHQIKDQGINTILHYEDVSSMHQSIEIRSPFMDYRLMEFAFSIPNKLKFSEGITKKIQRDTIGKSLPKSITENRKKIGFKTPFLDYLKNDEVFKKTIHKILNSTSFNSRSIWEPELIRKNFENPSQNPEFPYWRIINLEVWAKSYGIKNL